MSFLFTEDCGWVPGASRHKEKRDIMNTKNEELFDFAKMSEVWASSISDLLTYSAGQSKTTGLFASMTDEMLRCMEKMGGSSDPDDFHEIGDRLCRMWNEMYDEKISRFFHVPQFGLMRSHQEKAVQMVDKFNRFQAHVAELANLLCQPFQRSQKTLASRMVETAKNGDSSKESKTIYKEWVGELEKHFMTLLQTPQYVTALSLTLKSLSDFVAVRDEAIEDLLSNFPVAKKTEMDDMARELYEMKKRIKKLEKMMASGTAL